MTRSMSATAELRTAGASVGRGQRGTSPAMLASGLSKVYTSKRGHVEALRDMELVVRPGEFVSILGPSGCGKSTLLAIMAGLEPATTGTVLVEDEPVRGPLVGAGFMFQRDLLLDWRTCERNILLQFEMRGVDPRPHRDRAHELLDLVGLSGFAHKHPYELSGGMRQRVALCRALIHEPALLFMDEPFGALDALTRESLNSELVRITREQGTTVLLITHSIDEAVFLSDRVVVMTSRPGRAVADVEIELAARDQAARTTAAFTSAASKLREILGGLESPSKEQPK